MKNLNRSLKVYQGLLILINLLLVFLLLLIVRCQPKEEVTWVNSPASFVNPFIGTEGERAITDAANTVPGAVMPFGMLSFGPETSFSEDLKEHRRYKMVKEDNLRLPVSPGGYNYAANRLRGFSLTRLFPRSINDIHAYAGNLFTMYMSTESDVRAIRSSFGNFIYCQSEDGYCQVKKCIYIQL